MGGRVNEHPRAKLARLFGLALAYDRRGLYPVQWLPPDTLPTIEGPWRIYRF